MVRPLRPLLLFPLLVACAGHRQVAHPRATPALGRLFPLAVGNRWTYRVRFLGADETLTVALVSGKEGIFVDDRGRRYQEDRSGLRDDQRYLLREPLEPGKGWSSVISIESTEHYRVAAIGETVSVPAGRFEGCVEIEGRTPAGPDRAQLALQSYCPGVGLARVVTFEEVSGRRGPPQWREELTAFQVAGAGRARP